MKNGAMYGGTMRRSECLLRRGNSLNDVFHSISEDHKEKRTSLYPHRFSIFARLACQICVSSQVLSPGTVALR